MKFDSAESGDRSLGRQGRIRRRIRRLSAGLLTAVLVAVTAACGGGGESRSTITELTVGISAGLSSIDPAKDVNGRDHFFRYLAYEPLLRRDPSDGTFGPGLAEKFGYVGSGNTVYEFTLREDATFANGSPVDAAAVKAWFDYFASAGGGFTALLPLKSVTTVGNRVVRLELKQANPIVEFYLSSSNWGYVSQIDPARQGKEMLGAGPYTYDSSASIEGERYAFKANEKYYDRSVQHYKTVVVKVFDNPNSILSALRSGEIDLALGDSSTVKAADAVSNIDVSFNPGGWAGLELYDLAGKLSPLGDVRVRQALNYAVDRGPIATALMGKYGQATSSWLPLEEPGSEASDFYSYDPDRAKALLAEAGFPDGFSLKVLVQGWEGNAGRPMVQAVAADLAKVGVKLDITAPTVRGDFYAKLLTGEWPAAQVAQLRSPIYSWATNRWVRGGSLDLFGSDLSEPTRLLNAASEALPSSAGPRWDAFTRFVTEQAYMLPVFTTPTIVYTNSDRVAGVSSKNVTKYLPHSPFILQAKPR